MPISDLIVTVVSPGLFFGRINFINGELWGKITTLKWGVLFPQAPDFAIGIARHPSQIYSAILEGLLRSYIFNESWRFNIINRNPGMLSENFLWYTL